MGLTREGLFVLLELAKHAARRAAAVHLRAAEGFGFNVDTKCSAADLVTEVDREAESRPARRTLPCKRAGRWAVHPAK
jgi:fructose-1,6-bisphosphatase/inositol monophosphatase family enzyme